MSIITKSEAIANVALTDPSMVLPPALVILHKVTVVTGPGITKTVIANYTFGDPALNAHGIEYENDLGTTKAIQLAALRPEAPTNIKVISSHNPDYVKRSIEQSFADAADGERFLFVYPREAGDDAPFYEACGVRDAGGLSAANAAIKLADVGLSIAEPFVEIPTS